ncbi:MAG: FAD-dependent oxidoreductase, partial [Chloroflexales bacterium]
LMPWLGAERLALFRGVRYSSMALLATGTCGPLPHDFYGLLFPRRESALLASATIQAVRSASSAPHGRDTLALHLSGPAMAALRQCDDKTLIGLMLAELRRLAPRYDPTPQAAFQRLYRCPEALPEFEVGHFRRLQAFAASEMDPPGLAFAGDYLGGPFVEGAILSGEAAAGRAMEGRRPSK